MSDRFDSYDPEDEILLGLCISAATLPPGQTRTFEELAFYGNCSKRYIQNLEKSGLRKMRKRLIPLLK